MDATMTIKKRAAILLAASAMMLTTGTSVAMAAIEVDGVNRVGNNQSNRLVGTAESDRLDGRGGNDTLIGRADSDILIGGRGNDFIDARDPSPEGDRVNCGPGRDRVLIDRNTEDIVSSNCEIVRVR